MVEIKGIVKDIGCRGDVGYIIITENNNHDREVLVECRMLRHLINNKEHLVNKQVTYNDIDHIMTLEEHVLIRHAE